jgi:hypothetical protein
VIGPLEAGTDACSPDISCELAGPCFGANALHTRVFGSIACYQFHFQYDASGPLVQENSPAKLDLDTAQSFDVVFSSDRSAHELLANRDSSDIVVGSCTTGFHWNDRFTGKPFSATTGLYNTTTTHGMPVTWTIDSRRSIQGTDQALRASIHMPTFKIPPQLPETQPLSTAGSRLSIDMNKVSDHLGVAGFSDAFSPSLEDSKAVYVPMLVDRYSDHFPLHLGTLAGHRPTEFTEIG